MKSPKGKRSLWTTIRSLDPKARCAIALRGIYANQMAIAPSTWALSLQYNTFGAHHFNGLRQGVFVIDCSAGFLNHRD
jgi:hypothetical protein